MSCRDGTPIARYAELPTDRPWTAVEQVGWAIGLEEHRAGFDSEPMDGSDFSLPPLTVIGAAPTLIDFDPAGPERVLAFVQRVDRQADKMQRAYAEWAGARWGVDVPADDQRAPSDDERRFLGDWPSFYARWKSHVVSFSDSPVGVEVWSPSAEWEKTHAFEVELEKLRTKFEAIVAAEPPKVKKKIEVPEAPPVQSDGSKGFEESGGVKSGADAIPWGTIVGVVGLIAGAWIISSIAGVVSR